MRSLNTFTAFFVALLGMLAILSCSSSSSLVGAFRPSTLFRIDSPPADAVYKVGQTVQVHAVLREGDDLFVDANVRVILSLQASSSSKIQVGDTDYQMLASTGGFSFTVNPEHIISVEPSLSCHVRASFIYNDSPRYVDSANFNLSK